MKAHRHFLPQILRFFGLWAGITGGYATVGSTCPCCGRPGCPVNFGIATIFGAIGASLVLGRRILFSLTNCKANNSTKE